MEEPVHKPGAETSPEPSDEALMELFQRGDRDALTVLVRRHQAPLYNLALRLVGGVALAEEIVQETFARVVQKPSEFAESTHFRGWVHAIARNLCRDALRRGAFRRHASLDQPSGLAGGATLAERTADRRASVERGAVASEIRERVLSALKALPDDQREVYLLREISNLPFKEIADIVGAGENTVKSRMRYALGRLQEALCDFEEYARALR